MIFINLSDFIPSDNWLYQAWLLNAELKSLTSIQEKLDFIDQNRAFWSELKTEFPYSNKCWFSESKESVSIYEIEHFRPTKATVRSKSVLKSLKSFVEAQRNDWIAATKYKGHGYWWLAFNYKNYRNCGKKVNLIKSIRFPLKQSSFIAYTENDDWTQEQTILLDPTKEGDSELLTFDPDGKSRPTVTDKASYDYLRAHASIDIYGLNSIEPLVKHRESKWRECYKAIRRAIDKYSELEEAGEQGNMVSFRRYFDEFMDFITKDLRPAIDPSSEFSSVAKACIKSYSKYDWVNEYILNEQA